jgi:hypothetical protein
VTGSADSVSGSKLRLLHCDAALADEGAAGGASWLFLLLFAAKYQAATSFRKKSCAADGSAERPGILLRSSEVLGKPAKNARTRH